MTEDTRDKGPAVVDSPTTAAVTSRDTDRIKRITPPETKDGTRWIVQLSAAPTAEWLKFFKMSGEASASAVMSPPRIVFDRASASFRSTEDHVEAWIVSLDRWIAWTESRYRMSLDEASRERTTRLDTEARQRERIQEMNERFKNL